MLSILIDNFIAENMNIVFYSRVNFYIENMKHKESECYYEVKNNMFNWYNEFVVNFQC